MTTALGLFGVIVLIALNGYFVAAEFSFVSVRRAQLDAAEDRRGRQVARAREIRRRLSFMLSGAQLGITVVSVIIGYVAEPTIGELIDPVIGWFGLGESARRPVVVVLAFLIATTAQMLLGELFPKNLSVARPERVSLWLATSTLLYMRLAGPVIRLFDNAAARLLRLFGVEPIEELRGGVTAEELDFIVEESVREGRLGAQQAEMLSRSIEFPMLDAVDAMRHRRNVMTVAATANGHELRTVAAAAHSRLPVVAATEGDERDEVIGVIELKDLLDVPVDERDTVSVGTVMREPLIVPEQLPLLDVLARMREHITEMAVVVDEFGEFVGIITDEDLAEELVGPIDDEHDDVPEPAISAVGARAWSVPGFLRIDEIERETGVELPEGDYDTVAGLLLERFGHFPEPGEQIEVDGHLLTVLDMDGLRIVELRLDAAELPPTSDGDEGDAPDVGGGSRRPDGAGGSDGAAGPGEGGAS